MQAFGCAQLLIYVLAVSTHLTFSPDCATSPLFTLWCVMRCFCFTFCLLLYSLFAHGELLKNNENNGNWTAKARGRLMRTHLIRNSWVKATEFCLNSTTSVSTNVIKMKKTLRLVHEALSIIIYCIRLLCQCSSHVFICVCVRVLSTINMLPTHTHTKNESQLFAFANFVNINNGIFIERN